MAKYNTLISTSRYKVIDNYLPKPNHYTFNFSEVDINVCYIINNYNNKT